MMGYELVFDPHVAWPIFWAVAALGAIAVCLMVWSRMRGAFLRLAGLGLLLAALANPQLRQEERQYLPDVVAIILDESQSQSLGQRRMQTEKAFNDLRARLEQMGNVDVRVGRTVTGTTPDTDGTRVFGALQRIAADIPPDRFGGAFIISDGQVHDVPGASELKKLAGPIHGLLTGKKDEIDRRMVIESVPKFAITGQDHQITFKVEEMPPGTAMIDVTVNLPNGDTQTLSMRPNVSETLTFKLDRAGQNFIAFKAQERQGEVSLVNNSAIASVEGIRDRLRVLLVSGEPHPGERTWRNLLKSDAAVDLVHFTILRPPEKQDGTPTRELSLIAFPTRELFIDKIAQFDLVIFDRYKRQMVLPDAYLANVSDYVRKGGAILIASGPELSDFDGLAETPLRDVIPARPTGRVTDIAFKPMLTDMGRRHPVSKSLPGENGGKPTWGRWFRLIDADVDDEGKALMDGPEGKPLLVLSRKGEGRVAQILSDQGWLWARGYEGGGPQMELLRRMAHWLMKEPDLEEEALVARQQGDNLLIERRTLADAAKPVDVTTPSGKKQTIALQAATPGVFSSLLPVTETGLFTLKDGTLNTYAVVGNADQKESSDVRATADRLAPVAEATGGGLAWLEAGLPRVTKVRKGAVAAGSNWMGITDNQQFRVTALKETPLFSTLASLAVLLLALSLMWYREGR